MTLDPTVLGEKAAKLKSDLRHRIVGQPEAIDAIVSAYQSHLAGIDNPDRPVGSFLFLGPTGTGKTSIVEAAAESFHGNWRALTKVDCAEYQADHEVAKLIGAPPGYIGHKETKPVLTQGLLDKFQSEVKISLVLFDEVEKASPHLWNLLLGMLDRARLRLADSKEVDFSRSMVFLTSNVGAMEMQALLGQAVGFASDAHPRGDTRQVVRAGNHAARRLFPPEFINRIDKIAVFRKLGDNELRLILDLELYRVQERVLRALPVSLIISQKVKDFLLSEGTNRKYGARPLKRAIENFLVKPLANLIVTGQVRAVDQVSVGLRAGHLTFSRQDGGRWPVFPVNGLAWRLYRSS